MAYCNLVSVAIPVYSMDNNRIGDAGVRLLASVLMQCPSLDTFEYGGDERRASASSNV